MFCRTHLENVHLKNALPPGHQEKHVPLQIAISIFTNDIMYSSEMHEGLFLNQGLNVF